MSNVNIKSILENLKSDKVKQRQDALVALRNAFSQDRVISSIHYNAEGKSQPKNWLAVFQALFATVTIEKAVALKKTTAKFGLSTAASIRRLSEAANTVRWLIERTVQLMNKTVVKAVFDHLISMLPSDRTPEARLFTPVALDYAKALKCLVSYTPHVEHLDDHIWVKVVETSFNVILDDPIRSEFAETETEQVTLEGNSDMYEEDDDEEEEKDDEMADVLDSDDLPPTVNVNSRKRHRTPVATLASSKKRLRTQLTPTPAESPQNYTPSNSRIPVSLEQVEFASLLSIMIASPIAPILRYPNLATGILHRLERFLQRYPSDSSLLYDYLTILSSTLNHISLNKKYAVAKFARSAWAGLVGLWGTKDKRMKAGIIMILRHLFQFTICPVELGQAKPPQFDCAKEFGKLRDLIAGEAESRWGITGLSLEALRLQIIDLDYDFKRSDDIFIAKTFRAGWNFDADQALAWAIMELHADCVGYLYQLSESMDSSYGSGSSRMGVKRKSLEPISVLLNSIHSATAPLVRSYHLQNLLFVIDRHWSTLHNKLTEQVVESLLQYVTFDHATVQSWIFLNLAAIVQAEGSMARRFNTSTLDSIKWDSIWTHAVRRANVPAICRAACHAGCAVLASQPHATGSLSSHRILSEIETLTKDMDIQGPTYPFDSVCIFLSRCLAVASQDARLHRMQVGDKVLSWLIDAWKISGNKMKMPSNSVADILLLLEAVCGLSKRIELIVQPLLPQSAIVDTVLKENKVKTIQDYVLHAKLPPFITDEKSGPKIPSAEKNMSNDNERFDNPQLTAPSARERRISAFLVNALETLTSKWETKKESNVHPTVEMARQSLDITITGILFESLLSFNGTVSNRQVVQNSASLLSTLVTFLNHSRWSLTERLFLAHALEIFIGNGQPYPSDDFQNALSLPGHHSGIKEQTLQKLLRGRHGDTKPSGDLRLQFLRLIWQNVDLQDVLNLSVSTLRITMSELLTGSSRDLPGFSRDLDDQDGFGAIRTATQSSKLSAGEGEDRPIQHIFRICIGFLSYGPFLQSPFAEPTQDKELAHRIIDSATIQPEKFFLMCPIYFNATRNGALHLHIKNLNDFFDLFGNLLKQYPYSRNERFHQLLLDLLTSGLGMWKIQDPKAQDVQEKFCQLCSWLCQTFVVDENNARLGFRSWALRDAFALFLDKYLSEDPTEDSWPGEEIWEFPSSMLVTLNNDEDTRIRFRVATIMSPLFSQGGNAQAYRRIAESLPVDVENFEHILTRLLALGNMMIVNSAVRSGSYWNLLELCLYHEAYSTHIEAVLRGVSDRLGISPFSALFEAYASQLVHTVVNENKGDFMHFPPRILGYHDRKQFAETTFHVLAPAYILNDGIEAFERHCKLLQKSTTKGLQDCFGNIVGSLVAYQLDDSKGPAISWEELDHFIKHKMALVSDFDSACKEHLDGIILQVLGSLGDQDCSENGPIASSLQEFVNDSHTLRLFRVANGHRLSSDTFPTHIPNRPAYPTTIVLESLAWLVSRYADAISVATTYHVIQGLMNEIHRTPLVNEQIRLINALTLWMAYRHQDIKHVAILQIVVQGATLLLSQWDLARSAQSILEMAFRLYRNVTSKDSRFPNFLIRICSTAHDYASNDHYASISNLGISLEKWIDQQALAMTKAPIFQDLVIRALPAWPRQPSEQLVPFFDQTTLQSLASVLEDQQITSNKFRIVRRFKEQTTQYGYDDDELFANTYFWRLKDCMPSPEVLQDQDVESFADLLFLHHGQIRSFDAELHNLYKARTRHIRNFKKGRTQTENYLAQDAITLALLVMLGDNDPLKVYNAYDTLRFVAAVSSSHSSELRMPSDYRTGLELLKAHRRAPLTRPIVDMAELLKSDPYIESASNFARWISLLTILLCDALSSIDPFFGQLPSILASDTAFAEEILPILVFTLLHSGKTSETGSQSSKKILSDYFTTILSLKSPDISCIRSIVDVVLHLRYFAPSHATDRLMYNKWLDIDFTLLAQSAILCGAYTTALLFVELAAELGDEHAEKHDTVEQVLYNIYAHIDEPDGFYGIKTQDLHQFLLRRFHHEHQWDKAFRFYGAALEAGSTENGQQEGLVNSFHSFGFDRLAIDTLQRMADVSSFSDARPSAMNFKLGWRTENWDLPDQTQEIGAPLYRALRAIHRERDPKNAGNIIRTSLLQEMGRLRSLGSEDLTEIRAVSRDLMCLSQIKEWRQTIAQESKPGIILEGWDKLADMDDRFEFADLEPILATRISLVRSMRQREERRQIGTLISPLAQSLRDIEQRCLLRLSEAARASGQIQIALNSVIKAQRLTVKPAPNVSEEFAHVLWVQKEKRMAVHYLQNLVEGSAAEGSSLDPTRKALCLSRLGSWTSEAYLEKPGVIWEKYFSPAVDLLDKLQNIDPVSQATIYRECAMFAERQYHATLKSPDAIRWKVYVDRKKQEIEHRRMEMAKAQTDTQRHRSLEHDQVIARKLLSEDSQLFNQHNTLRESFLKQAIDMHSRCLEVSSGFDNDSAIRFCSLWFANFDDQSILDTIRQGLERIPSRKLVFLAHQLTARVAHSSWTTMPPNQQNLQNLVLRMCQEHPFHSLYQVYCLADHFSSDLNRRQSGRISSQATQYTQTERGAAASNILDRLRDDLITGERVRNVERLCDAYLEWAKFPISGNAAFKGKPSSEYDIPPSMKLLGIQNIKVPVSTAHTPVDPSMKYENCAWLKGYERKFSTAGGINLPKINQCHDIEGRSYKQLFKGEGRDDLRQDAVMEQVFDLVNSVLKHDRETRRRQLQVRGYKVIPLAPQAGLLEFVGNTAPIKDWLTAAHPKYRPQDERPNDMAARIKKYQTAYANRPDKQLEAFLQSKKRFKPVMRHYFTDNHKNPISWFKMRLRYTRSVATTSIVGHVLGLGDRHLSNILIDNGTGDVVHIDLGIAFDQGKLLKVPERVPFRMTADIVDGMGISGTSGVFQRCAEETLRVLRDESGVIMTVLEVFKHDPLHSWTASEMKVKQAQSDAPVAPMYVPDTARVNLGIGIDMSSGSAEEAADRALTSVARKLDKSLSVESTVNELVAEATDPMNLATIYFGWGPHL